jgi:hypothetical protein
VWQIWGFFLKTFYAASHKRKEEMSPFHTVLPSWSSQQEVITYWRSVQLCWLAEKSLRSDSKAVLKIVCEFLKFCGNWVQASCPFSPLLGFSHWKAKMGWLCGAKQMQKNVSLRSKQVKNFAAAGIRPKSL